MGLGKLLHEEVVLARAGLAIARHRHDPLLGHGGLLRLQAGRLVQVLEQGLEARQLGGEAADGALLSLDAVQLLLQQLVHVLALYGHQLPCRAGRIYLHLYPLIRWHACWKTPGRRFPRYTPIQRPPLWERPDNALTQQGSYHAGHLVGVGQH
ncbi:hypothetical protein D3C71_1280210 [compost metagenome]